MEDENKSDFEKIVEKLEEVGGYHHFSANDEDENFEREIEVEGWEINGIALIVVAFENGTCGLYQFVGKHGDPIENDLAFIENLSQKSSEEPECEFCGKTDSAKCPHFGN